MTTTSKTNSKQLLSDSLENSKHIWFKLSFFLIILTSILLRIYLIHHGAQGIIAERQFQSAVIARHFYFNNNENIPEWKKDVTKDAMIRDTTQEPPTLEYFVATLYRIFGNENLLIPRLLSVMFWVASGIALFFLIKMMASPTAAMISMIFFLFFPHGIHVSISFIPDNLMILFYTISLVYIFKYFNSQTMFNLLIASLFSFLSVLIKPFCYLTLLSSFTVLYFHEKLWKKNRSPLFLFYLICSLPISYYFYGFFVENFLNNTVSKHVTSHILFDLRFWKGWLLSVDSFYGYILLVISLLVFSFLEKGRTRSLLIGLWIGYVIFCFIFSHHIIFTGYYHLQLAIIISISLAITYDFIVTSLRNKKYKITNKAFFIIAITTFSLMQFKFFKNVIYNEKKYENEQILREIGKVVAHSKKTIYLATFYGNPLRYFGEFSGEYWIRPTKHWTFKSENDMPLSVDERLKQLNFIPEYFIVTDFDEFETHHQDMKKYLQNHAKLIASSKEYLIYQM